MYTAPLLSGSCMEIARKIWTTSGIYTLVNRRNQPFKVYCHIDKEDGYTVLSPETYDVDIADLYNVYQRVTIIHRKSSGRQYGTTIRQLARYGTRRISVQFNSHQGHKGIVNTGLGPYIYVGLTPMRVKQERSQQGYSANGVDASFTNCDGNPNGYFAFLFNHEKNAEYKGTPSWAVANQWIDQAKASNKAHELPDEFFTQFELHFGGCGALAQTRNFRDVTGAALALHYRLK